MTASTNSPLPSRSGGARAASARSAGTGTQKTKKRKPRLKVTMVTPSAHNHLDGLGAHVRFAGMRLINEANAREHWLARSSRTKVEKTITTLGLDGLGCPDWAQRELTVMLTRVSPGMLDGDGLESAFKHVRDAVAKWLGVDDAEWKRGNRVTWLYDQRRGGKGEYAIQILFRVKDTAAPLRQKGAA